MSEPAKPSFADMTHVEQSEALIHARRTIRDAFTTTVDDLMRELSGPMQRGELATAADVNGVLDPLLQQAPYHALASMLDAVVFDERVGAEFTNTLNAQHASELERLRWAFESFADFLVRHIVRLRIARDLRPQVPVAGNVEVLLVAPDPLPPPPKPGPRPAP
jgi:hypothetical protein